MEVNKEYLALEFKGNTKEYFKIYIVNLFLSIITLGIYSAWAKVRKNRYLYSNTFMDGSCFEYTANPINILKGRLLVVGGYVLFIIVSNVLNLPIVSMIMVLVFVILVPYIVHLALKFRLRYVKYRGIDFSYQNKTSNFYKFYILNMILLNIVTLGLAGPHNTNKFYHLYFNKSFFSNEKFEYEGKSWPFYKMWLKIFLTSILIVAIFPLVTYFLLSVFPDLETVVAKYLTIFVIASYFLLLVGSLVLKGAYSALQSNYIYKETDILDIEFKSEYNPFKMGYIHATNVLVTLLSFGLLGAWATIRLQKYQVENFYHTQIGDLQLQRISNNKESSLGEESSEFFDMDLG